jgi:hypothetical protein
MSERASSGEWAYAKPAGGGARLCPPVSACPPSAAAGRSKPATCDTFSKSPMHARCTSPGRQPPLLSAEDAVSCPTSGPEAPGLRRLAEHVNFLVGCARDPYQAREEYFVGPRDRRALCSEKFGENHLLHRLIRISQYRGVRLASTPRACSRRSRTAGVRLPPRSASSMGGAWRAILRQTDAREVYEFDIVSARYHTIRIWPWPHLRSPKYTVQAEKLALRTETAAVE